MIKFLRILLFPVVPIYFVITWCRNRMYDWGWKSSKSYDFPVICVGNLSVGGTGKSPTIEYLIRYLSKDFKVATLSRGYKRETSGFRIAGQDDTAKTIGDEPYQFYNKFDDLVVSVDSDRQHGIEQLMHQEAPEVILLDDAYQHRKVKAGLNILLTAYDDLYVNDIVLPTGNLREPRSGAQRADLIVVTKCPTALSTEEKEQISGKINPKSSQQLYFSSITYSEEIIGVTDKRTLRSLEGKHFTLVTGIANPKALVSFLKSEGLTFEHLSFPDHHNFTEGELKSIAQRELVLTTEKDYMRLMHGLEEGDSNIYYLPIQFTIDREPEFQLRIQEFVTTD